MSSTVESEVKNEVKDDIQETTATPDSTKKVEIIKEMEKQGEQISDVVVDCKTSTEPTAEKNENQDINDIKGPLEETVIAAQSNVPSDVPKVEMIKTEDKVEKEITKNVQEIKAKDVEQKPEVKETTKEEKNNVIESKDKTPDVKKENIATINKEEPDDDSEYESVENSESEKNKEVLDFKRAAVNSESDSSSSRESSSSRSSKETPDQEREDGDGEEETDKKDQVIKLDHDEDKKNPQYIPKKGMFYEHDDRTCETEEPVEKKTPQPKKGGRIWNDAGKWQHDMYKDDEQTPKSKQEIVDLYGYDIRCEEAPPKARRRRRYTKGPNKYERSWEDEGAYSKSVVRGRGRRPVRNFTNRKEDFPELPQKNDKGGKFVPKPTENVPEKKESPTKSNEPEKRQSIPPFIKNDKDELRKLEKSPGPIQKVMRRGPPSSGFSNTNSKYRGATAEEDIATLAKHFSNAVINVDHNVLSRGKPLSNENAPKRSVPPLSVMGKVSRTPAQQKLDQKIQQMKQEQQTIKVTQPEVKSSKRYSTQRQRSLPQATLNQPVSSSQTTQIQNQPPSTQQSASFMPPVVPPQQQQQPPFYPSQPPQHAGCETGAPPAGISPQNYSGMQVVAFLPPPPPPHTANTQPPAYPPLYVPTPPYIPPPTIAVQPGGTEVFQGAGITYYSPQTQMARPILSRRVKLAIPIVAPNDTPPEV